LYGFDIVNIISTRGIKDIKSIIVKIFNFLLKYLYIFNYEYCV